MKNFLRLAPVLVVLVAMGCGESGLQEDTAVTSRVSDQPEVPILPKWKLPWEEKVPGKADSYDDYRAANPEWYALTVPPDKPGFRTATEWQEMIGVLLGFPGSMGSAVNKSMAQMVVNGVDYVDWYIVVPSSSAQTTFVNLLKTYGLSQAVIDAKVHFIKADLDSIWMIDYGPFTLVAPDGSVAFADFRYYHQRVYDDAIPTKLGKFFGVTTYRAGLDYEGGNFQMDEVGTCYHSQGLFWENPGMTEDEIHDILKKYLGCRTFIVLAPLQDGTTHIDMFSKLVGKNVFVLGRATTATATQTTIKTLEQDASILSAAVLADGTKLTIYRIPMPYQKDNVWRTYTNSTLANGVNLWPVYSINKDLEAQALDVWRTALPGWRHVGINSDEIITWGGAMHCISRALPAGQYVKWVEDGQCVAGKCEAPQGGYDGSCMSSADCFGPKWLCNLNDCGTVQDCGDITWEGCCDGEVLKYCENGQLKVQNCSTNPHCGWNPQEAYYDCGTNGGSDPSGKHPMACPGTCTPSCTGKECGDDGCGGSCGTCPTGTACQNGKCVACIPNCAGKECGDDGCGGSCGTCQSGYVCQAGHCVQGGNEYPYVCNGPEIPSRSTCSAITTYEGCCDEKGRVIWCENGKLYCIDCANLAPQCGWDSRGFYNCQTDGSPDPSGKFPKACPGTCTPNCSGKECGDDGCGGSCGTCPAGKTCQAGKCVGCTPNCTGKECGDDGCGGSCGTCGPGKVCSPSGICVCQPNCVGKECGDDGCGGSCGTCSDGMTCSMGKCVAIIPDTPAPDSGPDAGCIRDCTGRECGDDGCGGSCGTCPSGQYCTSSGQCVPSLPDQGYKDTPGQDQGASDIPQGPTDQGATGKSGGGCRASSAKDPSPGALLPFMLLWCLALRRRLLSS